MTSNGTIASTDGEQQHLQDKKMEVKEVAAEKDEKLEKCYFDVLGLCCSSEVPLVEKILHSINGVKQVSVVVPSKTVIVVYDSLLVSPSQIAKALNQAKLEANVRVNGEVSHRKKWPSPYVILCGALLALSFLKYAYAPLGWLAVGAVAVGVWPIGMRAVAAVRNFTLDVNVLVLIAVIGTLALRDYLEAATIVFLFTVAEWLQSRASHKATAVMSSLMNIAPQKATVADTGEVVNVTDVKQNTILAVKAGESIPIDGVVAEGSCEVDEKALTGEAFPVHKQKDAIVWAGTINLNGYILVKTMALAEDCAVAKMAKLVEEAQNKRPKIQRLIDHCAKYYTPAVVLISAGLAAVPAALRVHDQKHWFHLALVVLVSACPCGLILSTPVATFCALSRAATSGLLIKGGDYIETLAKIKVVAFDKTGTITRGEFVMTGFQSLSEGTSMNELLYWVSSLESKSSHPIADAVVGYGRSQSIEPRPEIVQEFQIFPGEGVSGKIDGREIYVGNRKFGRRAGCVLALEIECGPEDGRTLGFVYSNGAVIGTFKLTDACRSGAADALKELKSMGITTALLTGDSKSAAMHAQNELGHALDAVHAELLPEEKARIVEDYKKSVGPTSMVGDGINDAPALATADVGISMGVSGTALATETGHVILMSNDVRKIPSAIKLAKRTRRKVIENLVFSISAKVIVLAVAFAGYPIIWLAVMADVLTCLLVILNSMLLLRQGHGHGGPSHHHSHGHHHHKGNCNGSSDLSNHNVHQHEKSGCCNGSSDLSHEHSHQHDKGKKCEGSLRLTHHHHAHDEKRSSHGMSNLHCHSHDVVNGSHHHGSSVSHHGHGHGHDVISYGNPSKSCEAAKCSSHQGSKTCSNNITCDDNKNDSGLHNRLQLQSIPRTSCEKEDCKDLEGQNGCLGGDGCGLSNKTQFETFLLGGQTDRQAVCCGSHVEEKVSDSAIEDDITIEVCGPGRVESNTFENDCHCTKEIRHEHSEPISNHACTYVDVVGNREIGGCCRSFRKECCQIHQHGHVHGSFAAGFGGGGLTEIVTE